MYADSIANQIQKTVYTPNSSNFLFTLFFSPLESSPSDIGEHLFFQLYSTYDCANVVH